MIPGRFPCSGEDGSNPGRLNQFSANLHINPRLLRISVLENRKTDLIKWP